MIFACSADPVAAENADLMMVQTKGWFAHARVTLSVLIYSDQTGTTDRAFHPRIE